MERLINGRTHEDIKGWMRCCSVMASCYDCPYNRNDYCVSEDVLSNGLAYIEHLESERDAALAKVPRWISVKDELPPKHLGVLLMNGHRMVASGYLTYVKDKCGTSLWCMDGVRRNDVTHWAKLPEPPKEDTHG